MRSFQDVFVKWRMQQKNLPHAHREMHVKKRASCVLIVNLQQMQDHNVLLSTSEGATDCIRGPVDRIRWPDLHTIKDAICASLVRANQVASENFESEPYLWKQKSGWNPGLEIWLNTSGDFPIDIKKIHLIVESLLAGLQRSAVNNADDFCSADLLAADREAVRQIVSETLGVAGGRRLAQPIHIQLDNQPTLKMAGKFGAKPSLANFHPQETVLDGKFVGFDLTKKELLFSTVEKRININFDQRQLNLEHISRLAINEQQCVVRTHRTIASNGQEVFAYLSCSPEQASTN